MGRRSRRQLLGSAHLGHHRCPPRPRAPRAARRSPKPSLRKLQPRLRALRLEGRSSFGEDTRSGTGAQRGRRRSTSTPPPAEQDVELRGAQRSVHTDGCRATRALSSAQRVLPTATGHRAPSAARAQPPAQRQHPAQPEHAELRTLAQPQSRRSGSRKWSRARQESRAGRPPPAHRGCGDLLPTRGAGSRFRSRGTRGRQPCRAGEGPPGRRSAPRPHDALRTHAGAPRGRRGRAAPARRSSSPRCGRAERPRRRQREAVRRESRAKLRGRGGRESVRSGSAPQAGGHAAVRRGEGMQRLIAHSAGGCGAKPPTCGQWDKGRRGGRAGAGVEGARARTWQRL